MALGRSPRCRERAPPSRSSRPALFPGSPDGGIGHRAGVSRHRHAAAAAFARAAARSAHGAAVGARPDAGVGAGVGRSRFVATLGHGRPGTAVAGAPACLRERSGLPVATSCPLDRGAAGVRRLSRRARPRQVPDADGRRTGLPGGRRQHRPRPRHPDRKQLRAGRLSRLLSTAAQGRLPATCADRRHLFGSPARPAVSRRSGVCRLRIPRGGRVPRARRRGGHLPGVAGGLGRDRRRRGRVVRMGRGGAVRAVLLPCLCRLPRGARQRLPRARYPRADGGVARGLAASRGRRGSRAAALAPSPAVGAGRSPPAGAGVASGRASRRAPTRAPARHDAGHQLAGVARLLLGPVRVAEPRGGLWRRRHRHVATQRAARRRGTPVRPAVRAAHCRSGLPVRDGRLRPAVEDGTTPQRGACRRPGRGGARGGDVLHVVGRLQRARPLPRRGPAGARRPDRAGVPRRTTRGDASDRGGAAGNHRGQYRR